jgi:hypothetical protein
MNKYKRGQIVRYHFSIDSAVIGTVLDVNNNGEPLIQWYGSCLPTVWFVGGYLTIDGEPQDAQQEGGKL